MEHPLATYIKQEKICENGEFGGTSLICKDTDRDVTEINGIVSTLICKQEDEEGIPYAIYKENHIGDSACKESEPHYKNFNEGESQSFHNQIFLTKEPQDKSDLNLLREEYLKEENKNNNTSGRMSPSYTASEAVDNNSEHVVTSSQSGIMYVNNTQTVPVSLHTIGVHGSFPVFTSQQVPPSLNGTNTDLGGQLWSVGCVPEFKSDAQNIVFLSLDEQSQSVGRRENNKDESSLLTDLCKQYECSYCGMIFPKESSLKSHLLSHNVPVTKEPVKKTRDNSNFSFFCDICNKGFHYRSYLESHRLTHDDFKPYVCEACGAIYKQEKNLHEHIMSKHKDGLIADSVNTKFKCSQCPMIFSIESDLKTHIKAHASDKPYICKHCGNCYKDLHTLAKHLIQHKTDFPDRCQYCNKIFATRNQLKNHLTANEGDGIHKTQIKAHICEICDKGFESHYKLKRHLVTHTGERNFQCQICGYRFKQLAHLKGHLLSHGREAEMDKYKKLKDNIIEKQITTPDDNTNIQCTVCGQKFEQVSLLENHSKIHENLQSDKPNKLKPFIGHQEVQSIDRPFKCKVCNLSFKQTSHLKAHMCAHLSLHIQERSCIIDGRREKIYMCEECPMEFRSKQALKLHILENGGDGIHKLPELKTFVKLSLKNKEYECDICHQHFLYLSLLTRHTETHHKKDKLIKCEVCDLEFKTRSELRVHFIESEGDGKHFKTNMFIASETYKCSVCDRKFCSENRMKHHFTSKHSCPKNNKIDADSQDSFQHPDSNSGDSLIQSEGWTGSLSESNSGVSKPMNARRNPVQNLPVEVMSFEKLAHSACNTVTVKISSTINAVAETSKSDSFAELETHSEIAKDQYNISSTIQPCSSMESSSFQEKPDLKSQVEMVTESEQIELVYSANGPQYKCPVCSKLLKKPDSVKLHMRTHNKQFKCDKCNKAFYVGSEFENHKENQYQCTFCEKRFCKSEEFKIHYIHQHRKLLKCQHCSKTFKSKNKLDIHVKTHFYENYFKCRICSLRINTKDRYKEHLQKHKENGKHLCDICGKRFTVGDQLKSHVKIHDIQKEIYKCDMCDKKYQHKTALTYHKKYLHSNRKLTCKYCDKVVVHPLSLRLHEMKHMENMPFECLFCKKRFLTLWRLKVHTVVHTKEKVHECNICHVKFSQFSSIYKHKKVIH